HSLHTHSVSTPFPYTTLFRSPYVKANKNYTDGEAICEAVSREHMRFVPAKSVEQRDIQSWHRVRSRLAGSLTQLATQVRERLSRSEEHTSELQSPYDLVCRLL